MKRQLFTGFVVSLVAALAGGAGCGDSTRPLTAPSATPGPAPTRLTIDGNVVLTAIGETSQLTATATYPDGTMKVVSTDTSWTSFDRSIVTISSRGVLTAFGLGLTHIRAEYRGQVQDLTVRVRPAGSFALKGLVTEPVNVAIGGATVEIIAGSSAGQSTKTSDYNGSYQFFAVSGDLRVRVTKEGYVPVEKAVSMTDDQSLNFDLTPAADPAHVAGTYQLTLTASDTCVPDSYQNRIYGVPTTLPSEAKSRTYIATITQDGARLRVHLSGQEFVLSPSSQSGDAFWGRVASNEVSFRIEGDTEGPPYDLLGHLAPTTYLAISGVGVGTLQSSTIEGTLDGRFWVFSGSGDFYRNNLLTLTAMCPSPGNRFVFERMSTPQRR